MEREILAHCAELSRCNQRGGRMLSILDLLDAQTLDLDLAAYLMARISQGVSFMVGARPGGAGKTTVMAALLNLVPEQVILAAATPQMVRDAANRPAESPCCYVCHEIGAGHWFAYLWGAELRAYCALQERGCLLATNLHADDLEETREQVCAENGVAGKHFLGFRLLIFLRVERGGYGRRRIEKVYESDGVSPHRLVYDARTPLWRADVQESDSWNRRCRIFLEQSLARPGRTIEEVRTSAVAFYRAAAAEEG